jgi:hypothetical protein
MKSSLFIFAFILSLPITFAMAAKETAPTAAPDQSLQEIAATLRDTSDLVSLTPTQGEAFVMLFQASQSADNYGTLLLLPDNHQHANWPGLLRYLRTNMPQQGWATLAITLPDLALDATPVSTPNPSTATVESNPALQDYVKQSQARIERTLLYAQEQKLAGKLIVIAMGSSATALLGAMQQGYQPSKLDGVILIDAYQPFPDPKLALNDETAKLAEKTPIKDLFQAEHPHRQQMQQRMLQAQNTKHYQAEPLPAAFRQLDLRFSEPELIFIQKRLRSWLESEFIKEKPKQ